ncbi:MAG TPA: hypothetical protein VNL14_20225 [Candidatus Acidoferrales bacterium]|nr:hypothetical protein [Candidatus Acidoferrales bacterium]
MERAAALERWWPYGAPLCSAFAALAVLFGLPYVAHISAVLGSIVLVCVYIFLQRQHRTVAMATMGAAATLWFIGNFLWLAGYSLQDVVLWWVGFLTLMIAGERLELSRLLRLSRWDYAKFLAGVVVLSCGLAVSLLRATVGVWTAGIGLFALALWLLRYDMAWRTLRQRGLGRFMALCLLAGYLWLALAGLLWISLRESFAGGMRYDAMLHSVFLGFVFSMIFAHAPVIFPSITGIGMPFRAAFYAHAGLLHLSLLARIGGDVLESLLLQQWGAVGNALAIILFLANNFYSVSRAKNAPEKQPW